MSRLLFIFLLLFSCVVVHAAGIGKPHVILWDAATTQPSGAVVTGYQVQGCQLASCASSCTPTDIPGAITGSGTLTYTDINVFAGKSYYYAAVTLGTVDGNVARSVASNFTCVYTKAKHRGSISVFP